MNDEWQAKRGGSGFAISAAKRRKKRGVNYVWMETAKASADEHVAQILGYLVSSRVEHGLLINSGAPKFEIKKCALSWIGEGSRPGGLIGGILLLFASLAPFRSMACSVQVSELPIASGEPARSMSNHSP